MLVTVWCVGLTLFSLVFVGVPVQWLLGGRRPLDERGWIHAPFLGLGVIVLVLQNLVYCNLPLARTAWAIWGSAGLVWVWLAACRQLRPCLATFPRSLYAVAVLVYLVQGAGLFVLGVRGYVGHAWSDQFNYTAMAEFYTYFPWKSTLAATADSPWLTWTILYKHDRIGQSLLQGFLALASGASTKTLFEPTILLSPALTGLALFALARRFGLGRGRALMTAAAAGLLPGLATIHLDSFLSHALSVPLLLLLPLALDEVHERPTFGVLMRAAVLVTTLVSVYTELTPLVAGILVLSLLVMVCSRPLSLRPLAACLLLAASPALLNWFFFRHCLWVMLMRVAAPVLEGAYPWAFSLEGWGRIWLGDLAAATGEAGTLVRLFTAAATGLAYLGLLGAWQGSLALARAGWSQPDRRRALALASCVLGLALAPILIGIKDDHHPYQFYKLLLTVGPLWVLGLALLPGLVPAGAPLRRWPRLAAALPLGVVLVLGAGATGRIAWESASLEPRPRSNAHLIAADDMRKLQELLEGGAGGDVLVGNTNAMNTSWLTYFARKNRVWLYNTLLVDANVIYVAEVRPRLDLRDLPAELRIVTEHGKLFSRVCPGDLTLEWSGRSFQLWRARSRNWALPLGMRNVYGLEQLQGQPYFWVGGPPTELEILAACPGVVTLSARIHAGPSLQGTSSRTLRMRSSPGRETDYRDYDPLLAKQGVWVRNAVECVRDWQLEAGPTVLTVPVAAGHSFIRLQALDEPNVAVQPGGDPRKLLIGVQGLEVRFTPTPPLRSSPPLFPLFSSRLSR